MRILRRLPSARSIAVLFVCGHTALAAAQTSAPPSDSTVDLFRALSGAWDCAGGFARGGSLAADLTFTPIVEGHALAFSHVDRAPGMYWQHSTWAREAKTQRIVSHGVAGSKAEFAGLPASFASSSWTRTGITLVADTTRAPGSTPNRFSYQLVGRDSLKMRWEVMRSSAWVVGDSLLCRRAR